MLPRLELLLDKVRKNKLDIPEMDVLRGSISFIENIIASDKQKYVYFTLVDNKNIDVVQYLLRKNGIRVSKHMSAKEYKRKKILRVLISDLNAKDKEFIEHLKTHTQLPNQILEGYIQQIVKRSFTKQR